MYQIIKDGLSFYVNDEEKARGYADDGYEVYQVDRLRINSNGKFEVDEPAPPATGTGSSEELPSPVSHSIGG